ncbi:YfhO family protein [Bacillus sp. REN3]|uniref:YfhO family protein n=1 Tax=Bacillus sp. REN3 TaxID=2802440 RepID=UPI001AEE3813|nr:YfhO family protein [Bacillus sp. REN3]
MNKFTSLIDKYIVCLLVLIPILGFIIFYRLGENDLFYISRLGDIKEQYIHFFNLFHELVRGGEMPFWAWSYGPGGSFWNEFGYYMLGDVFIWPLLLLPVDWFPYSFIPMSILKLFLMSLGMYLFLKEFGIKRHFSFLAGLAYSFSILYFEYFYTHYFFVNSAVFFPFILLGYEKYITSSRKTVLICFIFLASISNFYFLFMTTAGLGIYSIFRYFAKWETDKSLKGFFLFHLRLSGVYLLGIGLSMLILLPSAIGLFESNFTVRPEKPFFEPYLAFNDLIKKLLWDGGISFLPFMTVPLLLINGKRKMVFGLMAILLVALISIQNVNSIIGGFSLPLEFRSFFIFNVFFIMLSAIAMNDFAINKKRNTLVVSVLAVWLFTWIADHPFSRYPDYLEGTPLVFAAGLILYGFFQAKVLKAVSIFLMSMSVLAYSLLIPYSFVTDLIFKSKGIEMEDEYHKGVWGILPLLSEADYTKFYDNEEVKDALAYIKEDPGFYRLYFNHPGVTAHNSSMTYSYNSYYTYNSLVKWNLQYFEMDYLGQLGSRSLNLLRGYPNSTIVNTLLNNKYFISLTGNGGRLYGYEQMVNKGKLVIEKNKNWLPIGFLYGNAMSYEELDQEEFSLKEEFLLRNITVPEDIKNKYKVSMNNEIEGLQVIGSLENAAFGSNTNVTASEKGTLVDSTEPIEILLPLEDHRLSDLKIFVDAIPYTKNEGMTIDVSTDKGLSYRLQKNMRDNQYLTSQYSYRQTINKVLFRMGTDNDTKEIKLIIQPGKFLLKDIKVTASDFREYERQVKEYKANSLQNIAVKNNSIKAKVRAGKDSFLFLSIPYSKGWNIWIDGEKAETFPAHHAFTGVYVPEGARDIEMQYTPEGFKSGLVITLLSIVVLVFMKRKQKAFALVKKQRG